MVWLAAAAIAGGLASFLNFIYGIYQKKSEYIGMFFIFFVFTLGVLYWASLPSSLLNLLVLSGFGGTFIFLGLAKGLHGRARNS
jgi:hypothetical protein